MGFNGDGEWGEGEDFDLDGTEGSLADPNDSFGGNWSWDDEAEDWVEF